jgi:hypothetical protein
MHVLDIRKKLLLLAWTIDHLFPDPLSRLLHFPSFFILVIFVLFSLFLLRDMAVLSFLQSWNSQ